MEAAVAKRLLSARDRRQVMPETKQQKAEQTAAERKAVRAALNETLKRRCQYCVVVVAVDILEL